MKHKTYVIIKHFLYSTKVRLTDKINILYIYIYMIQEIIYIITMIIYNRVKRWQFLQIYIKIIITIL